MSAARVAVLLGACAAACSLYGEDEPAAPTTPPPEPEAGIVDVPEAGNADVSLENVDSGVAEPGNPPPDPRKDAAKPLPDLIVFVSSKTVLGSFSSVGFADQIADTICQDAAVLLLPRKFRALLTSASFDARDRVLKLLSGHRIVLPNGGIVAEEGDKMLGSSLLQPIALDENNVFWPPATPVWTGIAPGGGPSSATCGNWNSEAPDVKAAAGSVVVGADWASRTFDFCNTPHHFYCFEVP